MAKQRKDEGYGCLLYTSNSDSDTSGKEKTYTLYIGTQAEDGTTYVMPKGSGIVYKVTTTVCKNILNQK